MQYLKKYGIHLFYTVATLILFLLLITTLYYFNIIGPNIYKTLKIIIVFVNIFCSAFILGRKTLMKGYLEGLKLGIIFSLLLLVLTFILNLTFKPKILLYYIIIISTSILGSMIGISRKKEN